MRHSVVQQQLYEYLRGELDSAELEKIESHLKHCAACRAERDGLAAIIAQFPAKSFDASGARSPGYWQSFASRVERRLQEEEHVPLPKRNSPLSLRSLIDHMIFTPRPYVTAFGGALAIFIVALFAWRWIDRSHQMPVPGEYTTSETARPAAEDSTGERLRQYMSQSKMLLVGVSNMKPVSSTSYDLSVEREKSRELIHEARFLQKQPIDARSQRLIADLQTILIELANMKEEGNAPNVEILRGGLHKENLLFKIRMEEQTLAATRDSSAKVY